MGTIVKQLSPGDKGIEETIQIMQFFLEKYTNTPEIKQVLVDNGLLEGGTADKVKNIYNYVAKRYTYKPDPNGIELVKSPKHTIIGKKHYGDCDDLSVALATLLRTAGIQTRYRTVAWKRGFGNQFTHVYVICFDGTNWIPLDPSAGYDGYKKEVNYFRKKDW